MDEQNWYRPVAELQESVTRKTVESSETYAFEIIIKARVRSRSTK